MNVRKGLGGLLVAGLVLTMAACSSGDDTQTVTVGPEREDCYGPFLMKCLVVDGGLFYSEIERFEHEPGYTYRLRIEKYDRWDGEEPPQDAGKYGYRLIEVLSKER